MDADANFSVPLLNTGAHGSVTLPDSLTFGIGHKFNDKTRVELGATYTKWSTYDKLEITLTKICLKVQTSRTGKMYGVTR
jgi:long-chain fatty acid transport protein